MVEEGERDLSNPLSSHHYALLGLELWCFVNSELRDAADNVTLYTISTQGGEDGPWETRSLQPPQKMEMSFFLTAGLVLRRQVRSSLRCTPKNLLRQQLRRSGEWSADVFHIFYIKSKVVFATSHQLLHFLTSWWGPLLLHHQPIWGWG